DDPAGGVDRDAAIGVAIEGESHVGAPGGDLPGERGGRGRPGLDVDVHAVGVVVDDLDRGPGCGEDLRPGHPAGSVRAVEDDPQAAAVHRAGEPQPDPT